MFSTACIPLFDCAILDVSSYGPRIVSHSQRFVRRSTRSCYLVATWHKPTTLLFVVGKHISRRSFRCQAINMLIVSCMNILDPMLEGGFQTKVPDSQNVGLKWIFKKGWSHASCHLAPPDEKGFSCIEQFKKSHGGELWVRTAANIHEAFNQNVQAVNVQISAQQSKLDEATCMYDV